MTGRIYVYTLYLRNDMRVRVKKWGNSAAIRIPAALLDDAKIALDDPVELYEERGRIVMEPTHRKIFTIDDLVRRIRPENLHEPIDTGPPQGREVW